MTRKLKTSNYMVDGWDRSPHLAVHPYKRGSKHNKIGMIIMWSFYVTVSIRIIHFIYELNILNK